jgi:hypothetical protein
MAKIEDYALAIVDLAHRMKGVEPEKQADKEDDAPF